MSLITRNSPLFLSLNQMNYIWALSKYSHTILLGMLKLHQDRQYEFATDGLLQLLDPTTALLYIFSKFNGHCGQIATCSRWFTMVKVQWWATQQRLNWMGPPWNKTQGFITYFIHQSAKSNQISFSADFSIPWRYFPVIPHYFFCNYSNELAPSTTQSEIKAQV